ncbi:hypothetical protein EJB05_13007, partial [Eragrostis curvula]
MAQTLNGDPPAMLSGTGACGGDSIPVVDFDVLVKGSADERSQAIRDLGRACDDWGIFMVINHGVPEALKDAVMKECNELLSLPEEEKAEYLETSHLDPIHIGTALYPAGDGDRNLRYFFVKMFVHPEFHCPAKPEKLRDVAAQFATQTRGLMLQLTRAISESLALDGGRIPEALNLDNGFQKLILNHYPADTGSNGVGSGIPSHTDNGLFTLIFENGVDGLQVQHNGQWISAKLLPGAFFVLVSDQLEIVSNERYKAVMHRVVIGGEQARTSILSMFAPGLDTVVEPVQELAAGSQGQEFRGIKYQEYVTAHRQSKRAMGQTASAMDVVRAQVRAEQLI